MNKYLKFWGQITATHTTEWSVMAVWLFHFIWILFGGLPALHNHSPEVYIWNCSLLPHQIPSRFIFLHPRSFLDFFFLCRKKTFPNKQLGWTHLTFLFSRNTCCTQVWGWHFICSFSRFLFVNKNNWLKIKVI